MSTPADGASAAAADDTVKIARPTASIRRRPKRSPSAAPVSRRTAKVRVYALTVHSRLSTVACRSSRITGSAVVTTRLSSVAMKTAAEVIAKVQMVRVLAVMDSSFGSSTRSCCWGRGLRMRLSGVRWCGKPEYTCEWSLTSLRKKRVSVVLPAALDEALRPALIGAEQVHRCDHVQEHPLREEVRDALRRQSRDSFDVVDELAVAVPHHRANRRVVAGCVGLHLRVEIGRIGRQPLPIGLADRP